MGRRYGGAVSTGDALKIKLQYLLKRGLIKRNGLNSFFSLSWTRSGETVGTIGGQAFTNESPVYLELSYSVTERETGEKKSFKERINLVEIPSNLGRGTVLYFECPKTFKLCRVLYMAFGSKKFMSREAYKDLYGLRIYYSPQLSSHRDRHNERYWRLDGIIEDLQKGKLVDEYNGKTTRKRRRLDKLLKDQDRADQLRWTEGMDIRLMRRLLV